MCTSNIRLFFRKFGVDYLTIQPVKECVEPIKTEIIQVSEKFRKQLLTYRDSPFEREHLWKLSVFGPRCKNTLLWGPLRYYKSFDLWNQNGFQKLKLFQLLTKFQRRCWHVGVSPSERKDVTKRCVFGLLADPWKLLIKGKCCFLV